MNRLVFVLAVAACSDDDSGPRIETVEPAAAPSGTSIFLHGSNLCAGVPTCHGLGGSVQLGLGTPSYQLVPNDVTDEMWRFELTDVVPVGKTDVLITLNGHSSNSLPFEVLP